jgi:hypothetical protein
MKWFPNRLCRALPVGGSQKRAQPGGAWPQKTQRRGRNEFLPRLILLVRFDYLSVGPFGTGGGDGMSTLGEPTGGSELVVTPGGGGGGGAIRAGLASAAGADVADALLAPSERGMGGGGGSDLTLLLESELLLA